MKDNIRVYYLELLMILPFLIVVFVPFVTMSRFAEVVTFEWILLFVLSAAFALLMTWKSPRVRHYHKALAEFEDNYRYEKEEAQ